MPDQVGKITCTHTANSVPVCPGLTKFPLWPKGCQFTATASGLGVTICVGIGFSLSENEGELGAVNSSAWLSYRSLPCKLRFAPAPTEASGLASFLGHFPGSAAHQLHCNTQQKTHKPEGLTGL